MIKAFLLALTLAASLAGTAAAGPFEDGFTAYDNGDYATALRLWRPFADQGNAIAQNNLGIMYANGEGVPQDYAQAVIWYRKAADQGYAKAQLGLGLMYSNGQGVPQDYIQAHMWWNLAASRYTDPTDRADAVKNRDLVAAKLTPAQVVEAQRLASAWKPK